MMIRKDAFVRFVNLLMNDTTYLLDESLTKLADIRTLQDEMASPTWEQRPEVWFTCGIRHLSFKSCFLARYC